MTIPRTMTLALACVLGASGCTTGQGDQAVGLTGPTSQAQILEAYAQSYKQETDKQYDASEQSIRTLAEQGDEFAQLRQAWLAYNAGNYRLSIARYSAVVARNPSLVEARLGLMLPLMAQSRWREAAAQANVVLAQHPGQYIAHLRLLRCEEAMKQWDVVVAHADQLAPLYPSDPEVLLAKARALAARRQIADARTVYATVLTRAPENEEAQLYLRTHP